MMENVNLDFALNKIKAYCAYSERCHFDVKNKLYEMKLYPHQVEEIVSKLIEENFLNEQRYATAYAGGKFRINKWGKQKIIAGLKQKYVSSYCIKKALLEIDEDEYLKTARKLIEIKFKLLGKHTAVNTMKVKQYMFQKGYENSVIDFLLKK